ncbi:MAG: hypothetical protein IPN30_17515 [Flavobacteriales bacterium]|nr:hypothetical protein [Flavobacteriales bacterium]
MTNEDVLLTMLKAKGSMGQKAMLKATGWSEAEYQTNTNHNYSNLDAIGRQTAVQTTFRAQ